MGFSIEPISVVMEPSLTTIDRPGFEIGEKATEILLGNIENGTKSTKGKTTILKSALIERDSTRL